MNLSDTADTLYDPLVEYIVNNHREEVTEMYTDYIDEFLTVTLGDLTPQARRKLTKHLIKKLIK